MRLSIILPALLLCSAIPVMNEKPADLSGIRDHDTLVTEACNDNALIADAKTISAATGGVVNFTLKGGLENRYRLYIMLGSATGTEPGTLLIGGFATLPLNKDLFMDQVYNLMNSSIFRNFLGFLNPKGEGVAQLNFPDPIPPRFVGLEMNFAYAVGFPWDFTSNPVMIEVVP